MPVTAVDDPTATFVCVWFEPEGHVLLLDRRTVGAGAEPLSGDTAPGWRFVFGSAGPTREDYSYRSAYSTSVAVWPPLRPVDLPLLIGPDAVTTRLDVIDLRRSLAGPTRTYARVGFALNRSLALADAHACWVLPCLDPEDAWRDGLFGYAVRLGHDASAGGSHGLQAEEVVARARAISPAVGRVHCWLVVPIAGSQIGPAVLAHHRQASAGPIVDVVMERRPDGTRQPVVELRATPGTGLREVIDCFEFYVLRRNAPGLGLPDVARSIGTRRRLPTGDRVVVTLPEPVFHGDVIGIVGRGIGFTFARYLAARGLQPARKPDGTWVALLVRRENDVSAVANDQSLENSNLPRQLCAIIRAAAAPQAVDRLLWLQKRCLAAALRRIGVATSHLLPPTLSARGRVELARLLTQERTVRLDHLTYTAAVPRRMESLLAQSLPFDHPWRRLPDAVNDGTFAELVAEVSGIADLAPDDARRSVLLSVLDDPEAARALLAVSSRSSALAAWRDATAL